MAGGLPAISGPDLAKLLVDFDGWKFMARSRHGNAYCKQDGAKLRITTIPRRTKSLSPGTLAAILSEKQTGLGRAGLLALLKKQRKHK